MHYARKAGLTKIEFGAVLNVRSSSFILNFSYLVSIFVSLFFFLGFQLSTTYAPKFQLRSYVAQVNSLARCRLDFVMLAIIRWRNSNHSGNGTNLSEPPETWMTDQSFCTCRELCGIELVTYVMWDRRSTTTPNTSVWNLKFTRYPTLHQKIRFEIKLSKMR
jgi:hypothetical protein